MFDFMRKCGYNGIHIIETDRFLEFKNMTIEIESFIHYLEDVKQSSRNTVVSYQRDLRQLKEYL